MPILYNVGNKLTAGSEPPQLYRYQDRVLGDGGTLETRDEASTFIRRLRSAGVLGSTVIAGVAGGVQGGNALFHHRAGLGRYEGDGQESGEPCGGA
jgi:hypothetical protein